MGYITILNMNIPTLYIKDKWYKKIISGEKKYEYRIGIDFYKSLNRKIIWLSSNCGKSLIYVKNILENEKIPYLFYNELLKIYSNKKIDTYGIIVLEIMNL